MSTTITAPIVLRSRPATVEPAQVYCSECWEPIAHDGDVWRHVRTGTPAAWNDHQCAPLCDWPDCTQPAIASIGSEHWTGAAFRYYPKHFLCAAHRHDARALGLGLIERT